MTTLRRSVSPMPPAVRFAASRLACPHLGLVDDPATHCTFASSDHRCQRPRQPALVPSLHQLEHCLTARHTACPVFTGAAPVPAPIQTSSRRGLLVPGGVAVTAVFVAVLVAIQALRSDPPARATNQSIPALATTASLPAQHQATPTTQPAELPATATAPAPATAAPAPSAPPPPTPARYRVREGDTLTEIAAFYGSRLEDVIRANQLPASGNISVGQELIIPVGP